MCRRGGVCGGKRRGQRPVVFLLFQWEPLPAHAVACGACHVRGLLRILLCGGITLEVTGGTVLRTVRRCRHVLHCPNGRGTGRGENQKVPVRRWLGGFMPGSGQGGRVRGCLRRGYNSAKVQRSSAVLYARGRGGGNAQRWGRYRSADVLIERFSGFMNVQTENVDIEKIE